MASYVIFEPPGAPQPENAVFVRDGFHWLAFLVPFFWFLWHRLWIEAGLVFAAMIGVAGLERVQGMEGVVPVLSILLALGLGFEAPALRMAALRRRGWREWGAAEADIEGEAVIRYLSEAGPETPPAKTLTRQLQPMEQPGGLAAQSGPALGLFSYPTRH